jgi:hypothetical protein
MKKASLCIFLFVSCSIAQPQWRQVFKADNTLPVTSLSIDIPQDKSVDPVVIFTIQRYDLNSGYTVLSYDPLTHKIDTVGINNVDQIYCQRTQHTIYSCDDARWVKRASYDTSRLLSGVARIFTGDSYDCGSDCPYSYYVLLTQTTIQSYCVLSNYCSNVPFQIFFHPTDGTILYGLTNSGLAEDHFVTCPSSLSDWTIIKRDSAPNFFYIAQDDPQTMFLNAQDTLWHSSDGGLTWSVAAMATVSAMTHVPHTNIYAAASADSLSAGLYISADGGKGFLRINPAPSFSLDADQTSGKIYAGTKGAILQFSINEPISVFDSIPGGGNVIGVAAMEGKIIYADSGGVYETDSPNAVHEPIAPNGTLSIENYPNPFSSTTTLKINGSGKITFIKIYDMLGREVADLSKQISNREILFDGSGLPAGMYACHVIANQQMTHKLIMLEK